MAPVIDINALVHQYLVNNKLTKTAQALIKELGKTPVYSLLFVVLL